MENRTYNVNGLHCALIQRKFKITTRAFQHRINREIRVPQLRLIDQHGEQRGVVDRNTALSMAEEADMDLVEISPNANPPVVKIMDYGKFCYEQNKKASEAKKKSKSAELKEVQFRVRIDEADFQTKVRNICRFLDDGDKVKVRIRFNGREIVFKEQGFDLFKRLEELIGEKGHIEQTAKLEGRFLQMSLAPGKKK